MYVGIDHGTSGYRVAVLEDGEGPEVVAEVGRREVAKRGFLGSLPGDVVRALRDAECVCCNYGMGDALTAFTPIDEAEDMGGAGYGLAATGGAGVELGSGKVYVRDLHSLASENGVPVYLAPGIHRDTPSLDPCFRVFSHVGSGEKFGTARMALEVTGSDDVVVCDASSNVVSLVVKEGRVVGGIDACLGAPGVLHGPLDLEAIREVDSGEKSANEAFSTGGIVKVAGCVDPDPERAVSSFLKRCGREERRVLAKLIAWEVCGLADVFDLDVLALGGSLARDEAFLDELEDALGNRFNVLEVLPDEPAAKGLAMIARDISEGARSVLGVPVARAL
ncbi:MAG: methanogenesis marker 12 protein [Methanopyri archaeon]|nr:methanogenesis marker 12 protein [Methanopyri archaeon]